MMCTYLQRKMLLMLHKIEKNWKKNVFGTVQKSDARGIHTTQFVVPLATALLLTVHFFFPLFVPIQSQSNRSIGRRGAPVTKGRRGLHQSPRGSSPAKRT